MRLEAGGKSDLGRRGTLDADCDGKTRAVGRRRMFSVVLNDGTVHASCPGPWALAYRYKEA